MITISSKANGRKATGYFKQQIFQQLAWSKLPFQYPRFSIDANVAGLSGWFEQQPGFKQQPG